MKRSFQDWEEEALRLTFGIRRVRNHPAMTSWMECDPPLSDFEKNSIIYFREPLIDRVDFWNEDELKFYFIAPFMRFIGLFNDKYATFTQRLIVEKVKDIHGKEVELYGRPEYLVAIGQQNPRQPFFFLKEYKPEKRGNNDPLGQLLSAMIAAQHKNKVDFPLKGCYVLGRNWFFVILFPDGLYVVSDAFVATQDDVFQIYKIFKTAKAEIEALIERSNFV
jgi:hypothetical protein